jgi:hypothetical protein
MLHLWFGEIKKFFDVRGFISLLALPLPMRTTNSNKIILIIRCTPTGRTEGNLQGVVCIHHGAADTDDSCVWLGCRDY